VPGTHDVEVDELWSLSANLKLFPVGGRFQPYGMVGLMLQHAKLDFESRSQGLTTVTDPGMVVVNADYSISDDETRLDGAFRVGLGIDLYVTEHVALEVKGDYVVPFDKIEPILTDYGSVRWGLLYRF
jgi:opacity protein-like surface antigen